MKKFYNDVGQPVSELVSLVYNHFGNKPMGWTKIDKLTEYAHNEQFIDAVLELYIFLKNSKDIFEGINPSQYYKIIYKFQLASKELNYDVRLLVECYLFLANYSVKLYNNMLNKAYETAKSICFCPVVDKNVSKKISFLSAVIRSYSESVFCDEHTISGEIISPLNLSDGTVVICRRYTNLDAFELFEELNSFPYKTIVLMYQYKGIKMPTTDIVGNLLNYENISEKLIGFDIELTYVNGEKKHIESNEAINEVINLFGKYINSVVKTLKSMNIDKRLWQKIQCEYYALKPFRAFSGNNWLPHKYKINISNITNPTRPIVKANQEIASLNEKKEIIQKLTFLNDPRVHW